MGLFTTSAVERFGPDLLDRVPLGISIYRLERPADPASFRLVYSNDASATITGLDADAEVGRMVVDVVPDIGATGLLDVYLDVLQTGGPRDLGPITYGDDRLATATYAIQAVPLAADVLAIVFEDVTDRAEVQALRHAQAELGREEARYRSLVEATASIVWTTPPSGQLDLDAQQWHHVTGQTPEQAAGWGWLDAVHPDDRDETRAAWSRAVATETPYEVEHRLRQPDGTYRRMAARGAPVRSGDGAVVEWVGIHTDIEAQTAAAAALTASEARFQTLFDALDDVLLVYPLGPDGPEPFVTFNQAAVATYGWTADELRTKTVADVVAPDRVDLASALAELRRTRRATFESTHVTRDGTMLPMATSARLVEVDGRLCVVALCRDDSDRRQFRRALSRSNRQLEEAVAERTAQLEAFSEDLKILHGITTAEHASPEARFEAYLRAGCEMFDLPIGILSATPLDPETGRRLYRIEAVVSPDPALEPGLTVPLGEAFCDAVVEQGRTVVYADAAEEAPEHPACVSRGLRAFIGTPVLVDGETVGTLNFVSPEPREGGFSASERDLVEVMAQAVGRRIEADRVAEAETTTRERYRTIVETVNSGVIVVDADFRVTMSNPSARTFLGLEAPDPGREGETDHMADRWPVVDEHGRPVSTDDLPEREALRTGKAVRGVIQGVVPPGQPTRWYRVNATPIDQDHDGTPDAVVVSFQDVTEFRGVAERALETQDLLEAVLAASPDGTMAFRSVRDEAGAVTDLEWVVVNRRAAEIVGKPVEALVGGRLLDVFPGNRDAGLFDAYVGVVETGEPYAAAVPYAHDGFETTFRVTAVPLAAVDGLTVTFTDLADGGEAGALAA
ncbi:PAS domain S-box protein [Rubrivirga sp.]|uniref:PAS domain S-box protein n=1 Tax=Rubrivirga sp. TaxID=1885344 RepID=UPI003B521F80